MAKYKTDFKRTIRLVLEKLFKNENIKRKRKTRCLKLRSQNNVYIIIAIVVLQNFQTWIFPDLWSL